MSGYNGRRAPNFSQYLNELNTAPSFYDQADLQQQSTQDLFDDQAELAMFTNAEFLEFDPTGADLPAQMPPDLENSKPAQSDPTNSEQSVDYMDMLNDFKVPGYSYYSSSMLPVQQSDYSAPQPSSNDSTGLSGPSIIQPAPAPTQSQGPTSVPAATAPAPVPASVPQQTTVSRSSSISVAGGKRKQDNASADDGARMAQEEDKRRRNTAASARFRIKKKEREKNLERTVKEVTTKNTALEGRITQLELENRWLKNLITEKNDSSLSDGDLSGMFNKFRENSEPQQSG